MAKTERSSAIAIVPVKPRQVNIRNTRNEHMTATPATSVTTTNYRFALHRRYFFSLFHTLNVRLLPSFAVKSVGRSLSGAAKQNVTVSPSSL